MAGGELTHRNQRSTALDTPRARFAEGLTPALSVAAALVAFWCYHATLLPGLDLGDSASFQTGAGSVTLTPRMAYPLYYGLGNVFVWLHPGEPARAMNLASAVFGALAVGVATAAGARLANSNLAGVAAGLFLAFSYTFWSHAVTAEVYTLHILMMGAALLTLLRWAERPSSSRLAAFYAVYAVGFGNHLSMVLLLPGFAAFLLLNRPRGPADPLNPRMLAMACLIAAAGALQYAWNLAGVWASPEPPTSITEALQTFWIDVTKADWRDTLVMSVSLDGLLNRPAMYWFDIRQQFGAPGAALAAAGIAFLAVSWPRRALLLALLYGANVVFAWTYNVGDVYVFFLPSHYVVALCAGAGVVAAACTASRWSTPAMASVVGALCLLYPAWRGYDTFPAVDRSRDTRAVELLERFTAHQAPAMFGFELPWQLNNAAGYYMRHRKPDVAWFGPADVTWTARDDAPRYIQQFIEANEQIGRDVIVTPGFYRRLRRAGYDGPVALREYPSDSTFESQVASTPKGAPYVLGVLRSDRDSMVETALLAAAWRRLTGDSIPRPGRRNFAVIAGRVGEPPLLHREADRPFRVRAVLDSLALDIRMESWLPTDDIRRAGYGHVIVNRRHAMILERGVNFLALSEPWRSAYAGGLFTDIPRYVLTRRQGRQ